VDSVEFKWANGQRSALREPAVNRYHNIRAPGKNEIQR